LVIFLAVNLLGLVRNLWPTLRGSVLLPRQLLGDPAFFLGCR